MTPTYADALEIAGQKCKQASDLYRPYVEVQVRADIETGFLLLSRHRPWGKNWVGRAGGTLTEWALAIVDRMVEMGLVG